MISGPQATPVYQALRVMAGAAEWTPYVLKQLRNCAAEHDQCSACPVKKPCSQKYDALLDEYERRHIGGKCERLE